MAGASSLGSSGDVLGGCASGEDGCRAGEDDVVQLASAPAGSAAGSDGLLPLVIGLLGQAGATAAQGNMVPLPLASDMSRQDARRSGQADVVVLLASGSPRQGNVLPLASGSSGVWVVGGQGAGGGGNRMEGERKKDMSAIMFGRYCWRDSASSSASLAALTRHLQYNAQRLRAVEPRQHMGKGPQ